MSLSDNEEIEEMGDMLAGILPKVFTSITGPMSDLIKASTYATVDSLIDARERMLDHGWSEELTDMTVLTIINRNADVAKKIAEAVQTASSKRDKS